MMTSTTKFRFKEPFAAVPPGVKHAVTAPRRYGGLFYSECKCGWEITNVSFIRCEEAGNRHLAAQAED